MTSELADPAIVGFLEARGAGSIDHPGGTLIAHLRRTHARLVQWGASPTLATAGLCHACYGTAGFAPTLLALAQRDQLIGLVGPDAEAIVYRYASCDRDFFEPQLGVSDELRFRDRFTGDITAPPLAAVRDLVELTFANELDLVSVSPAFADQHGAALAALFARAEPLASTAAASAWRGALGHHRG